MKSNRILIPDYIKYLFIVYITGLVLFQLFRITFILLNKDLLPNNFSDIIGTTIYDRGLLFDIVASCYIIAIPFLILSIRNIVNSSSQIPIKISNIILISCYIISFAISITDFLYFDYYNTRITNAVLSWTDDMSSMIAVMFTDIFNIISILSFIALSYFFCKKIIKLSKSTLKRKNDNNIIIIRALTFSLFLYLIFIGLRGEYKMDTRPILAADASKSENTFINQAGLNPFFNYLHSYKDFSLNFIDNKTAIENTQNYLKIKNKNDDFPIAREITFNKEAKKKNVVLVIMESMCHDKTIPQKGGLRLTPNLNKIADSGMYFNKIYSSGVHTHNGIFGTLCAMPSLMKTKLTSSPNTSGIKYSGFSNTLKRNGYHNIFFCTTDQSFDGMGSFMKNNDFDEVVDLNSYDENEIIDVWGVPDHVLFDYSIKKIDSISKNKEPFFATILTITTHKPHIVPKNTGFTPPNSSQMNICYAYADWAIGKFMNEISDKEWFDNTVFLFIGDHGMNVNVTYPMPLQYHHTPMILYSKNFIKPQKIEEIGLQIDAFPTLMGILNIPYTNNTMGIDLNSSSRPFAYFSADNKIGCLNKDYFLVINSDNKESLYKYKNKDLTNYANDNQSLIDSMKKYTYSMMQTSQYLIENNKVGIPKN